LYKFLSYAHLSPSFHAFVSSVDSHSIHKFLLEVMSHPGWPEAMKEEMAALEQNKTWNLMPLPNGKKAIGCL